MKRVSLQRLRAAWLTSSVIVLGSRLEWLLPHPLHPPFFETEPGLALHAHTTMCGPMMIDVWLKHPPR